MNFQELAYSLNGSKLTYEYLDLHDRRIVAENGWKIPLSRGWDIFGPRRADFNPVEYYQERKNYKNHEIMILKYQMTI